MALDVPSTVTESWCTWLSPRETHAVHLIRCSSQLSGSQDTWPRLTPHPPAKPTLFKPPEPETGPTQTQK